MSRETSTQTDESQRLLGTWSRRSVLKLTGAGVGVAGLGSLAGAAQEDDEDDGENENGGDNGQDGDDGDPTNFLDDIIDPTWGYPLAADETDDVDVDPVVEMESVEGAGEYSDFPLDPQSGEAFPSEFFFDPVGVHVPPDDIVHFLSVSGEHTATAFHEKYSTPEIQMPTRIPDDVVGFTSPPVVGGESWVYQFETPGVYDILCLPHLAFGMVMRIVVADPESADLESETFAASPPENLPPNVARVLGATELEPANIVESGPVAWGDLTLTQE